MLQMAVVASDGAHIDLAHEIATVTTMFAQLNADQRQVYDAVMDALQDLQLPRLFAVDGPAGSGKTFLYNCLIHQLRAKQVPVIAIAFTGIASLLLSGGRTAHSQFGLPLQVQEDSTSSIKFQSRDADQAKIIIWDEVSMIESRMLNIVDHLLRDWTHDAMGFCSPYPFGGKIVLLGGDFRQVLPVLPRANPTQVVHFTVKYCSLWSSFRQMRLSVNMRASPAARDFATWLLHVGEGDQNVAGPDEGILDHIKLPPATLVRANEANHARRAQLLIQR